MSVTPEIREHVEAMRPMSALRKRGYLQSLIGPVSRDPHTMQFRALLITALREAEVWPDAR